MDEKRTQAHQCGECRHLLPMDEEGVWGWCKFYRDIFERKQKACHKYFYQKATEG